MSREKEAVKIIAIKLLPKVHYRCYRVKCLYVASFQGVHNNTQLAKNGEGLGAFIMWMASGEHEVDIGEGPNSQNNALGHPFKRFWTPDISVIETTRLD